MKKQFAQTLLVCSASALVSPNLVMAEQSDTAAIQLDSFKILGSHQAYLGEFTKLETPQSELSIDAETIEYAGAVDLNQALDLSASVARQNNFGGLWNSFAVRGFVGDENLPSNYLVNGFNAGRGFGGPRDLSGVESVEVLKGPRAALYGRGEPGGTIYLQTKRPTFKTEGELKVSAGSYDTYRTDFDWTSPLSENLAVRLVGFYEDAESFRDTIETEKKGLSPSITYLIGDDSQLTYELEYNKQEIPMDRGVIAINGRLGAIPENRFLGEPGYGSIETDVLGHQIEFQHDFNDDWSALVGFNYRDTSLEGWAVENSFSASPAANGDFARMSRYRDYEAKYRVFRAELSGSFEAAGLEHRVIVGVDADKFENDQLLLRDRDTDQTINIYNPVYGNTTISGLANITTQNNKVETQESVGFYLQDQVSLTDKLDVRVGARFDDYEQELNNRKANTVSKYSTTEVSPQFGVVYKLNEALSVYAAYGENFRPLSGATDDNNLDPNKSKSKELGVNFTLNDGALQGNLAIFDIEQSNISVSGSGDNAQGIGGAESQGIELDLYGKLTSTLNLWFSYTYLDAETKKDFKDVNASGNLVPAGSNLLNIPEQQLSLQLVKQTQLAGRGIDLIGGLVYVGERNGAFGNQSFNLPSYTTVRVAANYDISYSLELRAEINNLFDKEYYTNSYVENWVQPGTPRTANVSAVYRF
jgi:iron complex outermembrane receptor protein